MKAKHGHRWRYFLGDRGGVNADVGSRKRNRDEDRNARDRDGCLDQENLQSTNGLSDQHFHRAATHFATNHVRASRDRPNRNAQDHDRFVMNLPVAGADLRQAVINAWGNPLPSDHFPRDRVRQLVARRYAQDQWNARH